MVETDELKTLMDLNLYIDAEGIDDDERKKRLAFAENKRKEMFDREAGTNPSIKWHQNLLIAEMYYYYNQYDMHEYIKGDSLIERIQKEGYPETLYLDHVLVNKLISLYQTDQMDVVYLTVSAMTPERLVRSLIRKKDLYVPLYDLPVFLEMLMHVLSLVEKDEQAEWIDAIVSLLVNTYYHDTRTHAIHHEAENVFPVYNQLLAFTTDDSLRYQLISALKHASHEQLTPEPSDVPITFKTVVNKVNKETYEKNESLISFYYELYRDTFHFEFVRTVLNWNASLSFPRWKLDVLKDILFASPYQHETYTYLARFQHKFRQKKAWAMEYAEQHREDILEEIAQTYRADEEVVQQKQRAFHASVVEFLMKRKQYQEAVDYIYGIKPRDENMYKLLTSVYKQVGQYEDLISILETAQTERGLDLQHLIDEVHETHEEAAREKREREEKEQKERATRMRKAYFNLEGIGKKIIIILYGLLQKEERVTAEQVADVLRWKETQRPFLISHLSSMGYDKMFDWDGTYVSNMDETIAELAQNMVDPKLETKIIQASTTALYKPLFPNDASRHLYNILTERFPESWVFAQVQLSSIIAYEKIKPLVDADTFDYYLKTHVDLVIVDKRTSLPILGIEKESDYAEDEKTEQRNNMKNLLFQTAGIPLIRFRFTNTMDVDDLKKRVIEAFTPFLQQQTDVDHPLSHALLEQIDRSDLEVEEEIDMNDVYQAVEEAFGKPFMGNISVGELENQELTISIDSTLRVLEHSHHHVEKKIKTKLPSIQRVVFQWK